MNEIRVPFFQVSLSDHEIDQVAATLRSGWLTTGARAHQFEESFANAVGATHAVAVNSCTAALHLALEALNVKPNQVVLVPAMTFSATAEVVLHLGAFPLLVDCEPESSHISIDDALLKIDQLRSGKLSAPVSPSAPVVGIVPVHVAGSMVDMTALTGFASTQNLWIVEDAAHAFPSAWRADSNAEWQRCGQGTANVSCFSFYANKTVTTGEGGMAVTESAELADRMRLMSLHGLRNKPNSESWNYEIAAAGYKYNLTDIAAALGIGQLEQSEELRRKREEIAMRYIDGLSGHDAIELPITDPNRIHAWHLFQIRLRLERINITHNQFIDELKKHGILCSVHWKPLHLHPFYKESFGWSADQFPNATNVWERLVSLPLFPSMTDCQVEYVIRNITELCKSHAH